jgi:hypothetical protein
MTYKKGDIVTIFAVKPSGIFFIEGKATVIKKISEDDNYLVTFKDDDESFERYVDPEGQDNPKEYVEKTNEIFRINKWRK